MLIKIVLLMTMNKAVEAFTNDKGETYMSEAGHAENWSKAEVNPEVIKALKRK